MYTQFFMNSCYLARMKHAMYSHFFELLLFSMYESCNVQTIFMYSCYLVRMQHAMYTLYIYVVTSTKFTSIFDIAFSSIIITYTGLIYLIIQVFSNL